MTKIDSLRDLLLRAVPALRASPETLSIFVDRGRVAARAGATLSFEYRYTANLVAQDFGGSPDQIIVPVLAWISRHQPDLMAKPGAEPIAFEAELLDADTSDLSLTIELSERVTVETLPGGDRRIVHIDDDADALDRFEGVCGVNLWQLYLGTTLAAQSVHAPGEAALDAALLASTACQGTMTVAASLAGQAVAAAKMAGTARIGVPLAGDVPASTACQGTMTVTVSLAGQADAAAQVSGAARVEVPLAGEARGTATFTGVAVVATNYDADALAYFNAMAVAPIDARKTLIDNLIVGLKADGLWARLDWLMLFAAHDRQAGRINLRYPGKLVNLANNPSFTVDRGYFGDGSSSFVDIGESPSRSGNLYVQDDAHIGLWCNLNGSQAGIVHQMGQLSGTQFSVIRPTNDGGNDGYSVNANSVSAARTGGTSRTGHRTLSRVASRPGEMKAFFNGERTATNAVASTGVPTTMVMGRSLTNFSRDRFAAAYMGGGLQEAQVAALHNRLNTYLTAIGAN